MRGIMVTENKTLFKIMKRYVKVEYVELAEKQTKQTGRKVT